MINVIYFREYKKRRRKKLLLLSNQCILNGHKYYTIINVVTFLSFCSFSRCAQMKHERQRQNSLNLNPFNSQQCAYVYWSSQWVKEKKKRMIGTDEFMAPFFVFWCEFSYKRVNVSVDFIDIWPFLLVKIYSFEFFHR